MKKNLKMIVVKGVLMFGVIGAVGATTVVSSSFVKEVIASTEVIGTVTFSNSEVKVSGTGDIVNNGVVTITEAGTYIIKGSGENVQVLVDAKGQDVTLVLQGITIVNEDQAPIRVVSASSVNIVLEDGTTNTLSDTESKEEIIDENKREDSAVIYSKADLVFEGTGKLTINGNYNNGIVSKDTLTIKGGDFTITANNNGVVGKDSLTVENGTFNIDAKNDAFQSDNEEENLGFILIEDGVFNINSLNDGIQAESTLIINNGEFNIVTNGGSENNTEIKGNNPPMGFRGDLNGKFMENNNFNEGDRLKPQTGFDIQNIEASLKPDLNPDNKPDLKLNNIEGLEQPTKGEIQNKLPKGEVSVNLVSGESVTVETTSSSHKGLKAKNVEINGGTFVFDTYDDAIKGKNDVTINNGKFTISSGNDAIQADSVLTVNNGDIEIKTSYEGLEGFKVVINDGRININSTDDGVNAAGESEEVKSISGEYNEEKDPAITINGGYMYINSMADSIDSNGALFINGGEIYANGPIDERELAIDFDSGIGEMNGGVLFATSGNSSNMSTFVETSQQNSILFSFNSIQDANDEIVVIDKNDNIVLSMIPEKEYTIVLLSSNSFIDGETYTISNSSKSEEVTISSTSKVTSNFTIQNTKPTGNRGPKIQ